MKEMARWCQVCDFTDIRCNSADTFQLTGNTKKYRSSLFSIWECPDCGSFTSLDPVSYEDIYEDYPLNKRKYDLFAKLTFANLTKRLQRFGLLKTQTVLDYGCGNGLYLRYLATRGFGQATGYDPFVGEYSDPSNLSKQYDWVIANDVIEHVDSLDLFFKTMAHLMKPSGLLYLGTCEADGVRKQDLMRETMRFHQPFHRIILKRRALESLVVARGFKIVRRYRRSYMDTIFPFGNYRFLDELSRATGHNLDVMLSDETPKLITRNLRLLFFGFFGYFFPTAFEPAWIIQKV